jgi:hypothetical protein
MEKEIDKEDGWTLVTRGCKPKLTQPITTYTNNAFKPLSTNDNPKTNTTQKTTPVTQPDETKDTKKRQQDRV